MKHTIQKSLLSEKDLTFKKVFDIAQSYESAAKNLSTLQETGNYQDVHQVRASSRPCYRCGHSGHRPDQCKLRQLPATTVVKQDTSEQFVDLEKQHYIIRSIVNHLGHCLNLHPTNRLDYCLSHCLDNPLIVQIFSIVTGQAFSRSQTDK